jgi:nucleotide-binding universal stress UspA family protein
MYKHILVAVDESNASKRALAEAVKLAGAQNAQLRLINVVDQSLSRFGEHGWASSTKTQEVLDMLRETSVKILDEALHFCREAGLEVQTAMPKTADVDVANKIVEEAEQWPADLIIMGTHGRSGVQRLVLGSVAAAVVHRARVPVMLVREH